MLLSDEQTGKYIKLLCLQHQKGVLSEKDMLKICGTYDEDIFKKFIKTPDGYYNKGLKEEADKRTAYAESRRKNRLSKSKKDKKNISKTYVKHMEDEDININNNNGAPFNIALDEYEYCQNLVDAKKEWDRFDESEQNKVFEHIKAYIKNHEENDKRRYLPDFAKYLKEQRYNAKQLPYKTKKLTAGI